MIGEPSNIQIELTEPEATLFVLFRKYQHQFTLLLDSGIFEAKNGQAIINFDPQGLAEIKLQTIRYKR